MVFSKAACAMVLLAVLAPVSSDENPKHHHHHHRGHHHHHGTHHNSSAHDPPSAPNQTGTVEVPKAPVQVLVANTRARSVASDASDELIVARIKELEKDLDKKERKTTISLAKGHLNVNGPLPVDFSDRFAQGVAEATGCRAAEVELLGAVPMPKAAGTVEEVFFRSRSDVVMAVVDQAANPKSKLATGVLHSFLVSRDETDEDQEEDDGAASHASQPEQVDGQHRSHEEASPAAAAPEVDLAMPYGDLEPFGREDTAQELTESSIRESNGMVDQLERAEVAEEKRAVFRALTRLRGAAVTAYDGIARSQTGNIDDYARGNQWRKAHPVHHLAADEADVSKWAFPEDSAE